MLITAPSQGSANRSASEGVLGAMARPAPVSPLFNTPSIHHPTHTHRNTENTALGHSSSRIRPVVRCPPAMAKRDSTLAARDLAIVHDAWSAWRAVQQCKPHRRQRSSSPACPLLRLLQSACSRRSLLCRRLSPPARTSRTRRTVACCSRPRRRRSRSARQVCSTTRRLVTRSSGRPHAL